MVKNDYITNRSGNMLVGIDQFGRVVESIKGLNEKRKVGMFFWPWIGQPYASGAYDATLIGVMEDGEKILFDPSLPRPDISPDGQAHFWGKPLWGYYNSDDIWVLRRQLKMLTLAGVDFLVFDTTNAITYKNVYQQVMTVVDEMQREGWNPPLLSFYTHSLSMQTVNTLFRETYEPCFLPNTWYRENGKPMIIAYTDSSDDIHEAVSRGDTKYCPPEFLPGVCDFFTFRKPQWPFDPVYPDGFAWVEWTYPQPLHPGSINDGDLSSTMMSVSVASHPSVPMSSSITRGAVNWGRGWDPTAKVNRSEDVDKGAFFQHQWDHALEICPDTVFVGGWNE